MKHDRRRRVAEGLLILGCSLALGCNDPVGSGGVTAPILPQATLPQPLASDAFNRANENPIAGNWTSGPGNFADLQIVGNAVQSVTAGVDGAAYYNAVVWPSDQWSEAQLGALGVEQGGPAVRLSATAVTGYVFAVNNSGTSYFIAKGVNGSTPILVSGAHAFAVGDVLRLEVQGSTLRAYVNGTLIDSVVDADIPSGNAGLWIYNHAAAGLALDNWTGGGFSPGPAPPPPAAPTALAAAAVSPSQINLSWTDNATTEDGFRIERCAGVACIAFAEIATVGANVVSYQNTGLAASTSYSYQVRAFNAGGTSSYTNTATATTPTTPPAGGPLATDAFNRANENPIAGNWSSVAANLQLLDNAAQAASPNLGVNGVAFYNALTWPADQWSEVTISRVSTPGDNGPAVRIASGAPTYYYAPVFASGSLEIYRSINHSWTQLLVAGTAAVGDRVRLEVQGTTLRVYRNGVLLGSVQDTQIATGSAGMGQDGTSGAMDDWAGGGVAPGPAPAPPAAPTTLAAAAVSTSQINLSWTDNATTEDGFRIERCAGAGCTGFAEIATVGANVVSYQNTGLTASTSYSYRVRAFNAGGTSSYTNTATATTPAPPAQDRLPDLGMARLSDFSIDASGGLRRLRYSTTIVNVGSGKFELHGQRASTSDPSMSVVQRIFNDAGGWRDVSTPAVMVYAGDGHNHWHVHDLELSELFRLSDGVFLARSNKRGFCFWDNVRYRLSLPGAPQSPVYGESGCGGTGSLTTAVGLSIGWGDIYPASLPDQFIDITGLADGSYRLVVTADPSGWFAETNENNNVTWVDLELSGGGSRLRVLGYGPNATIARLQAHP